MADGNDPQGDGTTAQAGATGSATTPDANAGTGTGTGASTLESRLAGLEARLTEQGRQKTAAEKERDAAVAKLSAYEAGKIGNDEALKAQLAEAQQRVAAAEQQASIAKLSGQYPETFGVFGDAIANMSTEALAAAEARFVGASGTSTEPPTPRGNGAPRTANTPPPAKKPTSADIVAELKARGLPWQDDN